MAVNFTQFSEHTSGLSAVVTKAIGATGSAGDWLSVLVVGGADGSGLIAPVVTDNISGATGWELLFSATAGVGAAQIRNTCWRKRAVGGETSVTATFVGNSNKSMTGFLATGVSLLDLYVIDRGVATFDGTNEKFVITPGTIRANGEFYVGQAAVERFGLSFASFLDPPSAEGGSSAVESSACGTVAHTQNDGGLTTDVLRYGVRPEQAVYVSWLGITTDFGSTAYTDSATVTLTGVESAVDIDSAVTEYDVDDTTSSVTDSTGTVYVQTANGTGTVEIDVSYDGVTWYTLLDSTGAAITVAVTAGTPAAAKLGRFSHKYARARVVTASAPMGLTIDWGD